MVVRCYELPVIADAKQRACAAQTATIWRPPAGRDCGSPREGAAATGSEAERRKPAGGGASAIPPIGKVRTRFYFGSSFGSVGNHGQH